MASMDRKHSDTAFFGHPRGLSTLFFTEMWERFSYYGMRGLLTLFLMAAVADGGYGMSAKRAGAIYGLYTAGVYLLALPGGWIADRILGQRRAVFYGGVVIAAGHFSMAIPLVPTFYMGLILIVLGTGLLKPNVSTIVGGLYPEEEGARRDAGFSIFYMGINLGALFGPLICGTLGEKVNWHLGFSAAGIGMVLGLIQYRIGMRHMGSAGMLPPQPEGALAASLRKLAAGIAVVVLGIAVLLGLQISGLYQLSIEGIAEGTGYAISSLAVLYFLGILIFARLSSQEKGRVFLIFLLFLGAALFWSGFEQAGTTMNLFAKEHTQRTILSWEIPASWFQSVNPVFIIVLAPMFGALWVALKRFNPSLPIKFAFGLLLLGAGFFVMKWAAVRAVDSGNAKHSVSAAWLISTYFLHTCGELCLSPIGLSSVTKLAPKRLVSQMMGTWFMGAALGNLFAGLIAGTIEDRPLPSVYGTLAVGAGIAGLLFLIFARPIRKLAGGIE